jgi:hypothetical protein
MTMIALLIGWVFFRAASASDAFAMLHAMAGLGDVTPGISARPASSPGVMALSIAALTAWCLLMPNTQEVVERWGTRPAVAFAAAVMAVTAILLVGQPSVFLYYQF